MTELEILLIFAQNHQLYIEIRGDGWTSVEKPADFLNYQRIADGPDTLKVLRKAKRHIEKEIEKKIEKEAEK